MLGSKKDRVCNNTDRDESLKELVRHNWCEIIFQSGKSSVRTVHDHESSSSPFSYLS
jgi:hypothetical protein